MKKEKKLVTIPYMAKFGRYYEVPENLHLILDSINVYPCRGCGVSTSHVDFDVRAVNGKSVVHPLSVAESYLLVSTRLVDATVLEISAAECLSADKNPNGDYTFVVSESLR